jgi:N-acetylglucosamine malate deacetylase 1
MSGSVVVVAAHPDDEVLGCGGTLARFAGEGRPVHVLILADGESSRPPTTVLAAEAQRIQARVAAAGRACAILGCTSVDVLSLPDNRLDSVVLLDIVQRIETVIARHAPTTVFTHHSGDVNIDHRVAHDAVIAACRPQGARPVEELLFFETPSSTEWRPPASAEQFAPNWFVDISGTLAKKLSALGAYPTEMREFPHPRSVKAVEALAHWRGATAGVESAEAFVLGRKISKRA